MIRGGLSHVLTAALIAYLIADVAAVTGGLDALGRAIAVLAVLVTLVMMWAARARDVPGSSFASIRL